MKKLLFTLSLLSLGITANSQKIDTIHVGEKFKGYNHLSTGEFKYLVYMEKRAMQRPTVLMTSKVAETTVDNEEFLTISHRWTSTNPKLNGDFYSIVSLKHFNP